MDLIHKGSVKDIYKSETPGELIFVFSDRISVFDCPIPSEVPRKGEVICAIPSENVMDKPNRYTVQIAKDKHTHVGKLAALNHSCDPNVILDTERMLMIARYDIEKGQELSFFYPSTEWEMTVPFICTCGSTNCIHVVAGARYLSPAVLERYFLNQHIRRMINGLLTRAATRFRPVVQAGI
ncbi:MAG: SET domain-containing protein-lysine N-methyltransferase [Desulfobulbaceae bacterium]|nr:SET domain-containing protein-lysine N-methyltransferase [Desulfobulbaceae bacterium]